jgi:5-methyltetrahydrofolate corrinoid/iron sulfur protein methyltransferase
MIVVGENINASNRSMAAAIAQRDAGFLQDTVLKEVKAGADFIDVNAGKTYESETDQIEAMEWLVGTVQEVADKPIAVDSDIPAVIEAALHSYKGDVVMVNSITAEPGKLASVVPLVAERQAWVVALAMGEDGIPDNVEQRLAACDMIMTYLNKKGISPEQVFFDPLVLPISVDTAQGFVTLKTIEQIKLRFPRARTIMGLSNVSYGLPNRPLINRAFLSMAASAGLDAAILDPLDVKMMSFIKAANVLTNKDRFCKGFINANRRGLIVD